MDTPKFFSVVAAATFALVASTITAFAVPATATSAVNVRSGPGVSFGKIDALHAGQAVNVTECQGGWCYVEKAGPDGWVSGNYLQAAEAAPAAPAAPAAAPSAADDAAAAAAIQIFGAIAGAIINNSAPPPAAPPPPPPPPPPAAPTVISAAQVNLPLNWSANLDTGRADSGSFPGADISQQGAGGARVIFAQNGAKLSVGGTSQRGYGGCSDATYSGAPVQVGSILNRTICVKTNVGNISEFWFIGQTGTTLGVKYVTWSD
ncbi:hypothetical protein MNBD_ALPHA11-1941 [hydrothermal vent metagenome]|uniref:SH3b domain-containing protein n=1 Tax=hydrothermal vent metagenome TaxID=652676 RepID=A0A3B0TZA8_9ZZZZ